jgi:septum formation protein
MTPVKGGPQIILASGSKVRASLLSAAGVTFQIQVSGVDEEAIKQKASEIPVEELAGELAATKALAVSRVEKTAIILGLDQILMSGNVRFDKPKSIIEARERLLELRGKSHVLISACCAARGNAIIWRDIQTARLLVRPFTEEFLDAYMIAAGSNLLDSVGCYHLEGIGAQLFASVDGDYFAILGMQVIPILEFLRREGALVA